MNKRYRTSLFIFRRDLRLEDNTGLLFALHQSELVLPCFIFTPEQIDKNPYRSNHCLRFMLESIEDLEEQLKAKGGRLYYFHGEPDEIVERCIGSLKIDAVVVNRDYTPYSKLRDEKIEKACKKKGATFHSFDDALLHPPEETLKKDGTPYTIFTPYFKNASKIQIPSPVANRLENYFTKKIELEEGRSILAHTMPQEVLHNRFKGGRAEAMKILKKIGSLKEYKEQRDYPEEDSTSHLSPYLKFTVCSPREVHSAISEHLRKDHELIRSLHWRDFFTSIAHFFPYVFQGAFHPKFDKIAWSYDKKAFKSWCEGKTGCPIVDAGMREMNETGFMHNRVRMIAGSFLVKDLHIDWRWGEKYFATTLIDYDPAVNNGNWQWVASTGCDAQPYFRIFNPWNQQKKFDPDCVYIKQWIPELKKLPAATIHDWPEAHIHAADYPAPLVDHTKEAKVALHAYHSVKKHD